MPLTDVLNQRAPLCSAAPGCFACWAAFGAHDLPQELALGG